MHISTTKEALLHSLQTVSGVVEKRQTLPILANILINVVNSQMEITATDLEIEIRTLLEITTDGSGSFTIPARKLIDICRALPDNAQLNMQVEKNKVLLTSGNSRFTLSVLDAEDFPVVEPNEASISLNLPEFLLKQLLDKTQFAMAQQDVRYFLNGMLFEFDDQGIRTVATDGHRLAMACHDLDIAMETPQQIILPRKAVIELARLLSKQDDEEVKLEIGGNQFRLTKGGTLFVSKLIDGRFPEYQRVIPQQVANIAIIDRLGLREALLRTAILSNEKFRGVRFKLSENRLDLLAHNPEQEEAEEFIEIEYSGEELTIGFNVNYLIDTLNVIESESIRLGANDANSSTLIHDMNTEDTTYVIMPMRL